MFSPPPCRLRSLEWLRIVLLLLLVSGAQAAAVDFSTGWRFHLGDAPGAERRDHPDQDWAEVAAPHPARIEALVTDREANQQWEGICWYRKTFTLPPHAAGKVVRLRFEGAMNRAQVFVNGDLRTENIDGYTPFVVDLSLEATRPNEPITIALRLDNQHSELTGPKPLPILDFHLYHGLYRTVSLSIQAPLHITDEILENLPASGGIFVTYPAVSRDRALVVAQVHVRNAGAQAARYRVVTTLRTLEGREVARSRSAPQTLESGATATLVNELTVRRPRLWSPQAPHLHHLDVQLLDGNRVVDSRRVRIGIRRFEVKPEGIYINGERHFLRGVNRHQEYPYVGNAVPDRAQFRDAWKIKQAGFDFVRVAHYPMSPAFMAACDELGLVVLNAILGWQYHAGTPAFEDNRVAATRALVRRDRNHASSFLWEVSLNETRMSPEFVARLHAAAREEYPTDQMVTAGWVNGYDVKVTARQHGSTREFAAADFPCVVSEYGDWEYYAQNAGLQQDQWQDLKPEARNSRQRRGDGEARLLQQATNLQEAHNDNRSTRAFADGYWVMFDYNRGYADDHEASGVLDIFRLPKFSADFFRSQRTPSELIGGRAAGPMVAIASWWSPESPLDVRVFSNVEEVELWLNGRSLGRQRPDQNRLTTNLPHPPFTFSVSAYEPGELRAVGFRGGRPVAEHRVRSPGRPQRLEVVADLSGRAAGAGGDLIFVHARVVDEHGTVVPLAELPVQFQIEGDAVLLGENPRFAEAGIATILLKSVGKPGVVQVTAKAGELHGEGSVSVEP
jgi:beta-galactosidase